MKPKILLVDYTLETDREFNYPAIEKLGNIAECEVWKPEQILSATTLRGFGAVAILGVPDNIERYPFSLTQGDISPIKEAEIPVLGICLGHQLIGQDLGGGLIINKQAVSGIIKVRQTILGKKNELYRDLPDEMNVQTMHYGLIETTGNFDVLATSDNCPNQSFVDRTGLLHGVQFHPERSGDVGDAIFYNFARIAADHTQPAIAA